MAHEPNTIKELLMQAVDAEPYGDGATANAYKIAEFDIHLFRLLLPSEETLSKATLREWLDSHTCLDNPIYFTYLCEQNFGQPVAVNRKKVKRDGPFERATFQIVKLVKDKSLNKQFRQLRNIYNVFESEEDAKKYAYRDTLKILNKLPLESFITLMEDINSNIDAGRAVDISWKNILLENKHTAAPRGEVLGGCF